MGPVGEGARLLFSSLALPAFPGVAPNPSFRIQITGKSPYFISQLISNFNSICSVNSPLPCHMAHSQLLGIRTWMSLGGHYSACHWKTAKIGLEETVPRFAPWESPSGNCIPIPEARNPARRPETAPRTSTRGDAELAEIPCAFPAGWFCSEMWKKKHYFYLKISIDMLLEC